MNPLPTHTGEFETRHCTTPSPWLENGLPSASLQPCPYEHRAIGYMPAVCPLNSSRALSHRSAAHLRNSVSASRSARSFANTPASADDLFVGRVSGCTQEAWCVASSSVELRRCSVVTRCGRGACVSHTILYLCVMPPRDELLSAVGSTAASDGGNVFLFTYVIRISFFLLLRTFSQARTLVTSACLPALMPNAERPGVASRTKVTEVRSAVTCKCTVVCTWTIGFWSRFRVI